MGKLYVVATPIGNLEDLSFRALRILKEVDLIACEDTRHTKILLNYYKIKTPTISYHQYSKFTKIEYIINQLKEGKNIALVTDAGTPGISDPGVVLISRVIEAKIDIVSIPGPSAFLAAASISGLPLNNFLYLGFLPKKKGRKSLLRTLNKEQRTIIFYESPYRIIKTLEELQEFLGDREIVVCRELTKKFEQIYRGKISEVIEKVKPRGEFVVIVKRSDVSYQHESHTNNTRSNTNKNDVSYQHESHTNNSPKDTNKVDLLYPELSYQIRGVAIDIKKKYGSGHKENIYQNAFAEGLRKRGIDFEREKSIQVFSEDTSSSLGVYRPDFLVDNKIIVEIKAVQFAPKKLEDQLYKYLKNSKYELGYFINFGGRKLYTKRIIYTNDYKNI